MFVKSEWTDFASAKIIADMMDGFVESNSEGKFLQSKSYMMFLSVSMRQSSSLKKIRHQ